jgi:hypothetical protein
VENNVVCCVICGKPIEVGQLTVSTTTGDCVHVACADQEATQAYHRRTQLAVVSAALLIITVLLLIALDVQMSLIIVVTAAMAVFHGAWHRRWWNITTLRLLLYWRHNGE